MMTWRAVWELYQIRLPFPEKELRPSYNVAPYQWSPVVRRNAAGEREGLLMRWAIIPPWEPKPTTKLSTINARAETVATSRLYAPLFGSGQRCLVPASGFYEWRDEDKVPHYMHPTDAPCFTFAGMWSRWEPPKDADPKLGALDTFTIITTAANGFVAPLHERMPAMLAPEEWGAWLDPQTDQGVLKNLVAPREWPHAAMHAVSTFVNKVKNNSPECVAPIQ